jgi:hypothetical protein
VQKKVQFTQERVEYNGFLFDETLEGLKSLKIFKISLTFRLDKLSHLWKSVHTGENSQILTVSNKKQNESNEWQIHYFKTNNNNSFISNVKIRKTPVSSNIKQIKQKVFK